MFASITDYIIFFYFNIYIKSISKNNLYFIYVYSISNLNVIIKINNFQRLQRAAILY